MASRVGYDQVPESGSSHRRIGRWHAPADRHRAHDIAQFGGELRIIREFEASDAVRLKTVRPPNPLHRTDANARLSRHQSAGPMRGFDGRILQGQTHDPLGDLIVELLISAGRVLWRSRPPNPSSAKRSCHRQTQVFDLPVRRMISFVPSPSALNRTIQARQTCFCGAFRSAAIAASRRRSDRETVMEIPVRMPQTRTRRQIPESYSGLKRQI
jgi:hypothetical protein